MRLTTVMAALSAITVVTYASPHHSKPPKDTCHESSKTSSATPTSRPHTAPVTSTTPLVPTPPPVTSTTFVPTPPPSTSTSSAAPSCSQYKSLPASFYVHDSTASYLAAVPNGNGTAVIKEVADQADATVFEFYVPENSTVSYLDGQSLLAYNQTNPATGKTTTYSAWINGIGSAIALYNVDISASTLVDSDNFAVSAAAGYETCNLVLGAILEHDSSTVNVCNGTLGLYSGTAPGCARTSLTFSPAS